MCIAVIRQVKVEQSFFDRGTILTKESHYSSTWHGAVSDKRNIAGAKIYYE